MKKLFVFGLLISCFISSYCQNLDLVVTAKGDSIACKIDSITEAYVYIQIMASENDNWFQKTIDKADVHHYTYNCIFPPVFKIEKGTSRITGYVKPVKLNNYSIKKGLDKASPEQLNFYLKKANRTRTSGAILFVCGTASAIAGFHLLTEKDLGNDAYAAMLLAGTPIALTGITFYAIGESRYTNIKAIKKSKDLTLEIVPYHDKNYMTQNNYSGLSIRLLF
jgi:hypothetical protein